MRSRELQWHSNEQETMAGTRMVALYRTAFQAIAVRHYLTGPLSGSVEEFDAVAEAIVPDAPLC